MIHSHKVQGFPPGMHFYPYAAPYGYMQYGYQQYAGYPVVAAGGPPHYRPYGYNPYFPGPQGPPGSNYSVLNAQ